MIDDVEVKKQLSTEKPMVKGYNLFKSGHVLQLFVKQEKDLFYILSKVLPSMKKGNVYSAKITLKNNGSVHSACCGCPAGIDGRCNHVTASLFALENYSKIKENKDVNNDLPCTSMSCKWNIPRQVKVEPTPVDMSSL